MRALAPLVAVRSVADFALNGLLGLGRLGTRTALTFVSALVGVVFYFLLIPGLTWRGAVIGTFASELTMAVGGWMLLIRLQRQRDQANFATKSAAPVAVTNA